MADLDYFQERSFTVSLNGQAVTYVSKPGLAEWDGLPAAVRLLAEQVPPARSGRRLLIGGGPGALAVALARQAPGELVFTDASWLAMQMTLRSLALQPPGCLAPVTPLWEVDLPPELQAACEQVIMVLPKGRRLARRWLALAARALAVHGQFFLAGANDLGIQTVLKDATFIGPSVLLAYKGGSRVARFQFQPQASARPAEWLSEPGIAPGSWTPVPVCLAGRQCELAGLPGAFAYDRLDEGTRRLLEALDDLSGQRVVDVGCGIGLLGLAAALQGAAQVDLVDVDLLGLACARENCRRLGLSAVTVLPGDALSAVMDRRYTRVLTNPPFHAGRQVDLRAALAFIQQSWQVLEPGGQLWLVANSFLRYQDILARYFQKVERAAGDARYSIWKATR